MIWLRLLRLPNFFTVPGDPLAGAVLTASVGLWAPAPLAFAVAAALCLYGAGILMNDLLDVHEDVRVVPWRPFAKGLVRRPQVEGAVAALSVLGLLCGAMAGRGCLAVAGCLLAAILTYNFGVKKIAGLGPLNMGLCRGCSVLLGVAAVAGTDWTPAQPGLLAAAAMTVYIAAVTQYARYERSARPPRWIPILPLAGLVVGVLILAPVWSLRPIGSTAGFMLAFAAVAVVCGRLLTWSRSPDAMDRACNPQRVGDLLRALLWMQAGLICLGAETASVYGLAGVVALTWWPARLLGRRFYAS